MFLVLLQAELALCDWWNGNVLGWKFQKLGQLVKCIYLWNMRDTNESLDFDGAACRLLVPLSRNKVVTFSMWENCMKLNAEEMHGLCKYQNVEKQN